MSHYTVTVVVDDPSEESVATALAPFDENGEWFAEGSRWDWWVIGGRWAGSLRERGSSAPTDVVRKRDVDWDAVGAVQVAELRDAWQRAQAGDAGFYFDPDDAPQPGEPEDAFVRRHMMPFTTHAFLDLDGKWHENGRMGWFGVTIEDEDGEGERDAWPVEYQRLLAAVPDDAWLVIVDAHV